MALRIASRVGAPGSVRGRSAAPAAAPRGKAAAPPRKRRRSNSTRLLFRCPIGLRSLFIRAEVTTFVAGAGIAHVADRRDAIDRPVAGDQLEAHGERSAAGPDKTAVAAAAAPALTERHEAELLDGFRRRVLVEVTRKRRLEPALGLRVPHKAHRPIQTEPDQRRSRF